MFEVILVLVPIFILYGLTSYFIFNDHPKIDKFFDRNKNRIFYAFLLLTASLGTLKKDNKSLIDLIQIFANIIIICVGGAILSFFLKECFKYVFGEDIDYKIYESRIFMLSLFLFSLFCLLTAIFHHDLFPIIYDINSHNSYEDYEIDDR